jgi:hypothetical protein
MKYFRYQLTIPILDRYIEKLDILSHRYRDTNIFIFSSLSIKNTLHIIW